MDFDHINDENMRKLNAKSKKCVFIGYSELSKAYKFYNPITHRIITSRDVIFDEGENWRYSSQKLFVDDVFGKEKGEI